MFEGCRISALVGTTKYPQDVDLDRIAANAALEPVPPISMSPRFPRPSWVSRQHQPSIPSNTQSIRQHVTFFSSSELDEVIVSEDTSLESQVLSYKDDDTPRMMSLLYPDASCSPTNTVVGTGGLVNDVWANDVTAGRSGDSALSPRSNYGDDDDKEHTPCPSLRFAFVPRLDFSSLPRDDGNCAMLVNGKPPSLSLPVQRTPIVMSPPQDRTFSIATKSSHSELMESPRGIDDLDSLEPVDLEGQGNANSCFDMEKAVSAAVWVPSTQRSTPQKTISPEKSPRLSTADMIAATWLRTSDHSIEDDYATSTSQYPSMSSTSLGLVGASQYNNSYVPTSGQKNHGGAPANLPRAGVQHSEYSFPQVSPFKTSEDVIRCPIAPTVSFSHLQQELLLTQQLQQQQQLLLQQAQWMMSAFSQLQFQQQQMSAGSTPTHCHPLGMNVGMNMPAGFVPTSSPFTPNQCTSLLGQNSSVC